MENKLVINVNEIFSTDIVKLLESRCIHTDSQLFDLDTKSDIDQCKSYPVDIIGFRIDWII